MNPVSMPRNSARACILPKREEPEKIPCFRRIGEWSGVQDRGASSLVRSKGIRAYSFLLYTDLMFCCHKSTINLVEKSIPEDATPKRSYSGSKRCPPKADMTFSAGLLFDRVSRTEELFDENSVSYAFVRKKADFLPSTVSRVGPMTEDPLENFMLALGERLSGTG
jgi:hypothetical protein